MISVTMVDVDVYEVIVEKPVETCHRVGLSQEYYRHLCGGKVTHEWLIVQAFRFLLEREPNTAILASFDLSDINGYFPEFEEELALKLA
jgi:hypothetical protein